METITTEALIGPVEAAKVLGISRTSLYRMTRDRTIPHYGYFGNRYKYKVSDLIAWRESQRVEAVN